jgi:hypothetical protein
MEEMRKKLAADNKEGGASEGKKHQDQKGEAIVAKRRKIGKASKKIEINLTAENSDDEDDD